MRHLDLLKLVALSSCLAFAPLHPADAAAPSQRGSSPALESTSASKMVLNGRSLNGRKMNGRKMNGRARNGVALAGHTAPTDGGMSVISIRLPGAERRSK